MTVASGRAFSRREWILLIFILLLVEYGITTMAYNFSSEQNVLNYISFAATISSILLAVLAIIYGFYQNDSQQRVNGEISAQVTNITTASSELSSARTKLETQLDRIDAITSKIDELGSGVKDIQGAISGLDKTQRDMIASLVPKNPDENGTKEVNDINNDEAIKIAKLIFRKTTAPARIFIRTLSHFSRLGEEKNYKPTLQEVVGTYFGGALATSSPPSSKFVDTVTAGSIAMQVLMTLRSLGLLSGEAAKEKKDVRLNFSPELTQLLQSLDLEINTSKSKEIKNGIAAVDKIFHDNPPAI